MGIAETRLADHFTFDRQGAEIAALFAVVLGVTLWLALLIGPNHGVTPPETFGEGSTAQASAGAAWAAAEVAVAIAILTLVFIYNRLPEWVQEAVKTQGMVLLLLWLGIRSARDGTSESLLAVAVVMMTTYYVLDHYDAWWVANNAFSVLFAIAGGLVLGVLFGVPGMVIAFVLLTAYDHVFANKQSWMFSLGKPMITARFPVVFIRPEGLRFDWSEFADAFEKDSDTDIENDMTWGIGTADLMIPAGFVAALATTPPGALPQLGLAAILVVTACIVFAAFRLRYRMETHGSGAGLPTLAAGALAPYAVVAAVTLAL